MMPLRPASSTVVVWRALGNHHQNKHTHHISISIRLGHQQNGTTCASLASLNPNPALAATICLRAHRITSQRHRSSPLPARRGREGPKNSLSFSVRYWAARDWPEKKNAINIIKFIRLLALSSCLFSRCPLYRPLCHLARS